MRHNHFFTRRRTKRAQMKGEVKGGKEIANKKTNQTEKVWLVSWGGYSDYSVIDP